RDGVARDRRTQLRRLDLALRPRGDWPVADDGDADVRLVSSPAPSARVPPLPAVRAGPPRQLAAAPVRPRRLGVVHQRGWRPMTVDHASSALLGAQPEASQVQILPPPRERPWSERFSARAFQVLGPVAALDWYSARFRLTP